MFSQALTFPLSSWASRRRLLSIVLWWQLRPLLVACHQWWNSLVLSGERSRAVAGQVQRTQCLYVIGPTNKFRENLISQNAIWLDGSSKVISKVKQCFPGQNSSWTQLTGVNWFNWIVTKLAIFHINQLVWTRFNCVQLCLNFKPVGFCPFFIINQLVLTVFN